MAEVNQQENTLVALKSALDSASLNEKFQRMLGKKAAGFMTSIMTVVQNSNILQQAPANSIILAAGQAAALDLPISPSLGLAAIVPFKDNKSGTVSATLQVMRNGWVELALRTGQFKNFICEPVYEGELVSRNRFTEEYVFDESKRTSNKMVGYMASFRLINGYEKTVYWTIDELKKHGLRYSQTFKKGYGLWVTDFESMCAKTVVKNLIVKYAPKSIESLNLAVESDQAYFGENLEMVGRATPQYLDSADGSRPAIESADFQEAQVVETRPAQPQPQPMAQPQPMPQQPQPTAQPQPQPQPAPAPEKPKRGRKPASAQPAAPTPTAVPQQPAPMPQQPVEPQPQMPPQPTSVAPQQPQPVAPQPQPQPVAPQPVATQPQPMPQAPQPTAQPQPQPTMPQPQPVAPQQPAPTPTYQPTVPTAGVLNDDDF